MGTHICSQAREHILVCTKIKMVFVPISRLAWIYPFPEGSLSPHNTPAGETVSVLVLQMRRLHAEMKATQLVMVGSGPEYDPGLQFSCPHSAARWAPKSLYLPATLFGT